METMGCTHPVENRSRSIRSPASYPPVPRALATSGASRECAKAVKLIGSTEAGTPSEACMGDGGKDADGMQMR